MRHLLLPAQQNAGTEIWKAGMRKAKMEIRKAGIQKAKMGIWKAQMWRAGTKTLKSQHTEVIHRRRRKTQSQHLRRPIESGADWIELDVGVTKDGVLVVLHDEDLKRVAGDSRKIGELTFEEVRRLDVGSSFGPDFRGVGIPSLEEVLDYCKRQGPAEY